MAKRTVTKEAELSLPVYREPLRTEVTQGLLADITRRIVEAFHPYKVILFGSYAYGTPHRDSDIDLLVIMDSEERMVQRMVRVAEVAKEDFVPMDILVYTPEEIAARKALGDFFILEILAKGKALYERDLAGLMGGQSGDRLSSGGNAESSSQRTRIGCGLLSQSAEHREVFESLSGAAEYCAFTNP